MFFCTKNKTLDLVPQENWQRMQMMMMVMMTILCPLSLFRKTRPRPSLKVVRLSTSLREIFFSSCFPRMRKIV